MASSSASTPDLYAVIDADPYVLPLIQSALSKHFPSNYYAYVTINAPDELPTPSSPLLQIAPYESLDFTHLLQHPTTSLANSYIIRKALIRKHYLHNTITSWWSKHPDDANLKGHVPLTVAFEVDYAEYLDEALAECFELHESFAKGEEEWWILKPGMSDQGQGVRLFSSEAELRAIFNEWEAQEPESDEDSGSDTPPAINGQDVIGAGTMTSQLRHFVAQKYIERPLVFDEHGCRKFHIRSYVLAVEALRVFVYKEMLALFAPATYRAPLQCHPPYAKLDPQTHLTNTCLQDGSREGSVLPFWSLPNTTYKAPIDWRESVYDQICAATGTLFEAAAREQMIHFQTLENAFEVFGLDWIVDEKGTAWLLEVNAFPDFKQSGEELEDVVQGLWDEVIGIAVKGFFNPKEERETIEKENQKMRKVIDIDLGRR
ncbi:tubulin---tyrosine ligase, partial [Lecanoromycetidae sp. Uapishka_2]